LRGDNLPKALSVTCPCGARVELSIAGGVVSGTCPNCSNKLQMEVKRGNKRSGNSTYFFSYEDILVELLDILSSYADVLPKEVCDFVFDWMNILGVSE
jgi:hypothetical protein